MRVFWIGLSVLWMAAVVSAMGALQRYAARPGEALPSPRILTLELISPQWSYLQAAWLEKPTVLLFVHERCPCSRASIEELARASRILRSVNITVVMSGPGSGASGTWSIRTLVADRLPLATVIEDPDGEMAKRFGVRTSGHAVMYRADGKLHATGGLNPSRGHFGAGPGRTALETLHDPVSRPALKLPVFGCPIFSPSCEISYCAEPEYLSPSKP